MPMFSALRRLVGAKVDLRVAIAKMILTIGGFVVLVVLLLNWVYWPFEAFDRIEIGDSESEIIELLGPGKVSQYDTGRTSRDYTYYRKLLPISIWVYFDGDGKVVEKRLDEF